MPSCWATRTSLARDETAMPTQIDHPASRGAKRNSPTSCELCTSADATAGSDAKSWAQTITMTKRR